MPNLEVPAMSSPAPLSIVPVKPAPNRAINLFTFNTLNLDSPWVLNRSKDEAGFDSGGAETTGGGGDVEAGEEEAKSLDEHVRDWVRRRVDAGVSEHRCYFPFLSNAPKMVECRVCKDPVYPGEEIKCSVRDCPEVYHLACAEENLGLSSSKPFKCPQHTCFICKDKIHLMRCTRCTMASHLKCAPFPDSIIQHSSNPGKVLCWRHPEDWRLDLKQTKPSTSIEEVFCRLPLPYTEEDFKIDITWKNTVDNRSAPPPFVHIKRNIYLIKKRRDDVIDDSGCTSCWGTECAEDCVCRVQYISCSKVCKCSEKCSNRPFKTEKKISIVQTELCGWGVVAAEPINKRDFIIEYVGEVIDDALCEQRLWKMKHQKLQNFYMCELSKDFTIDATIKGNSSRFLNHGCDPNCKLEKWEVEGETRVGVFAARSIEAGEPLTYDYRFVQFGPEEVVCHCGASNCQGYLGTKRKISKVDLCQNWGSRRKRTSTACLAIVKVD